MKKRISAALILLLLFSLCCGGFALAEGTEEGLDHITDAAGILSDEQVQKLINLVRNLEKLDTNALMERVNSVKDALHRLSDVQNTAQNFTEKLRSFISTIVEFFQGLVD